MVTVCTRAYTHTQVTKVRVRAGWYEVIAVFSGGETVPRTRARRCWRALLETRAVALRATCAISAPPLHKKLLKLNAGESQPAGAQRWNIKLLDCDWFLLFILQPHLPNVFQDKYLCISASYRCYLIYLNKEVAHKCWRWDNNMCTLLIWDPSSVFEKTIKWMRKSKLTF